MASEDSDQFVSGFLMIHRLCDLCDFDKTLSGQMSLARDHVHTPCELLEVIPLRSPQGVLTKERDDRFSEICPSSNDVLRQVLLVIVVPLVLEDPSNSKELSELFEAGEASHSLRHDESMEHLIAGSVAFPVSAARLPNETD